AELVRRHEALRTGFVERAGRVYQQIASEAIASSALLAISDGPLDARLTAVITQSFDLSRPPLLRAELVRAAEGDVALILCLHHLVGDGWSIGIIIDELVRLYEAFAAGALSPLPPVAWQYIDLSAPADHAAELAWWQAHLADAPRTLELPTV